MTKEKSKYIFLHNRGELTDGTLQMICPEGMFPAAVATDRYEDTPIVLAVQDEPQVRRMIQAMPDAIHELWCDAIEYCGASHDSSRNWWQIAFDLYTKSSMLSIYSNGRVVSRSSSGEIDSWEIDYAITAPCGDIQFAFPTPYEAYRHIWMVGKLIGYDAMMFFLEYSDTLQLLYTEEQNNEDA